MVDAYAMEASNALGTRTRRPDAHTYCSQALMLSLRTDFVLIPAIFYVVVLSARLNLGELRDAGWLFDVGGGEGKWYTFYEFFGE